MVFLLSPLILLRSLDLLLARHSTNKFALCSCFVRRFSFLLYKSLMSGIYSVLLLVLSNIFMTFAWYGHLKLSETGISKNWPLIAIIAFSWGIAFFEYVCQVPANRIGFIDNGGPFTLIQLKVIQEVVSLLVFTVVVTMLFKGESFHWNHIAAFACLVAAVYFVFMK